MGQIYSIINFKENFTENLADFNTVLQKISQVLQAGGTQNTEVCESCALYSSENGGLLSKICEGYQFLIAFCGKLEKKEPELCTLSSFGYQFSDQSDSEIALFSYIHFGEKAPLHLSGDFSFIIYDSMRKEVFAFSSKNSSYPLFCGRGGDNFVISSSLPAIFSHPKIDALINPSNLSSLLYPKKELPFEIFEDVFLLPENHSLKIKDRAVNIKEYCISAQDSTPSKFSCTNDTMALFLGNNKKIFDDISGDFKGDIFSCCFDTSSKQGAYKDKKVFYIPFKEQELYRSIFDTVNILGAPLLSENDFLLPLLNKKAPSDTLTVFASSVNLKNVTSYIMNFLFENEFFHPAVRDTLMSDFIFSKKLPSPHRIISGFYNRQFIPFSCTPDFEHERPESLIKALRHILLGIIAERQAPILAFFKRHVLLSFCEGAMPLCDNFEIALLGYFIKLEIWLCVFAPKII